MLSNSKIYDQAGFTYDGCWFGITEEDFKEKFPDEYRKGQIAKLDAEILESLERGNEEERNRRISSEMTKKKRVKKN